MELKEYKPGTRFPGVVGRTVDRSSPAWPEPVRAREGAPNIHSNAMSGITEAATGFPGAHGSIPFENGFLSEMLLEHGYNTFPFTGKIERVTVDISGELTVDREAEIRRALARQ